MFCSQEWQWWRLCRDAERTAENKEKWKKKEPAKINTEGSYVINCKTVML